MYQQLSGHSVIFIGHSDLHLLVLEIEDTNKNSFQAFVASISIQHTLLGL
jgi:hypothetical protein